ncbi:MAG: M4 family metallopeptidase, partial [Lentimicrobiaceae bacterium]|nr:M4 family metallopeptidase [Lentimicrobiaceae bacterium]
MKKFLLPLLLFIIPQILFAQMSKKEQNNELRSHAKEIRWQGQMGTPALLTFRDDFNMTREQAIEYSKSFCAAENVDFKLKNQQTGKDGKNLYRYVQTIAGYPVEFSAWHIHEKNGSVTAVNGDIVDIQNFDITFSITEEDALKAALNYIGAELYMWMDAGEEQNIKDFYNDETATYYPEGIKIITPVHPDIKINKFRTAYKFNIYSKKPYTRKMVYVDAQTGEILFDLPLIHFENAVGTAHTQYSGIREINTYNTGSQYILQDNTRGNGIKTLNCQNGINYYAAVNFTDDDNIWNNENPQMDEYATDAHFSTMSTYDYYFNVHNRNSIDGNGYALASYVHFNLIEYGYGNNVNAFWNGQYMTYGDGDLSQGITPLTTLDICGHEITHGLTTFTADLTYAYESGALNESFSDIFGTSIEFYAVPNDANWTMGEKMGKTFRSMSNPKAYNNPNTYKGQFWEFSGYDNGGVHINSGVLNYWFYLICEGGSGVNDNGHAYQVQGIGLEKAEQIAFKTLTEYLTPSSQYIDVYYSAIIASGELFGGCSPEIQAVGDAFYAVGVITEPFLATTSADFKASAIVLTTLPAQVTFTNKSTNGITYLWDFGDGTTSTESNPVHVYTEEGNYSVTLSVYGGACGSDIITKEQYIKISTSYISVTMPINSHITK